MCEYQVQAKKIILGMGISFLPEYGNDNSHTKALCFPKYHSMESKERDGEKGLEQRASERNKSPKVCAVCIQISILTSCGFNESERSCKSLVEMETSLLWSPIPEAVQTQCFNMSEC